MNYEQKHSILQKLDEYFKNTPKEQIDKDWSDILKETDPESYYEQRYNEALERARALNDGKDVDIEAGTTTCEYIFPELKESKDERIRKELIQLISCMHDADHRKKGWLAWLEKQNPSWNEKDKNLLNRLIGVLDGTNEEDYHEAWEETFLPWLKSIKERMQPTDKVGPKFKVGDWITDGNCKCQITFIDSSYWYSETCVLGDVESINNRYHLWTLQDAKDGDVLAFDNDTIVIFENLYNNSTFHSYCHIEDGLFEISKDDMPDWWEGKGFQPATKEQHDLLFAKMKEAGYEWDADKKELKKMKVANEDERTKQEIRNFIWGYPDKLPERTKWLAWFEKTR